MMTYPLENRMAVEGQRIYEDWYGAFEDEYDDVRTLCDIYKCSDCPRYGDDCDGEFFEEDDIDEFDI